MSTEAAAAAAISTKEVMCSLPPMEHRDLERVVDCVKQLDSAFDSDAFWSEHAIRTCTGNGESARLSAQSQHIRTKMNEYQSRYTVKGVTARCSVVDDDDDGVIVVHTYAEHVDAGNCSTGSWAAAWRVQILTEKEAKLSGSVQLHVHYSESGSNVQTRATREFAVATVSTEEELVNSLVAKFEKNTMSYAEQLATKIVTQIGIYEEQLYDALSNLFENDVEDALRKIRRILPVTKTRFKWDSAAQKNVKLLNSRHNSASM